jgi:hypothetical protein
MTMDMIMPLIVGVTCLIAMALTVVIFVGVLNMVDGEGG